MGCNFPVKKCLRFGLGLLLGWSWIGPCAEAADGQFIKLPIVDSTDLRFAHPPLGEGPSHTRVTQIVQDNLGFMWFGTQDGLRRYDGLRFKEYQPDPKNPNSLSGVNVETLFKDRSGALWVSSDEFLDRYNPVTEVFTHYRSDPTTPDAIKGHVYNINQDREGKMWIATDYGLNWLDSATGRTIRYQHAQDDPTSLSSNTVRFTLESRDGVFWVATTNGLDVFNRQTGKVTQHIPLRVGLANALMTLFEDHAGVLWVSYSSGNGLAAVNRTLGTVTYYSIHDREPDASQLSGVEAILEDEDGALWLGTQGSGLLRFDRNRRLFTRYRSEPDDTTSLSEDYVYSLFEDRESGIWVGTSGGGVNRFSRRPQPFHTYRHNRSDPNSLADDAALSVLEDRHGILWVGTKGVLNRIVRRTDGNPEKYTFYHANSRPGGLSSSVVVSMAEDQSGYLWFGTFGGGLNRLDGRTGRFKVYRHNPADPHSLGDDVVTSLLVDHTGTLWAGTDTGLSRFDPKTGGFWVYRTGSDAVSQYHSIAEDSDGALWLATWHDGLQRFDPATGRFTIYRHDPAGGGLSSDWVNWVVVDHSGGVWAGTQIGLDRFDLQSGTFVVYGEHEGLPNSTVTGILEDGHGNLWLSTNNGLSQFNPRTQAFKNFYASDGISANEFNRYGTAYKSSTGELFFCSYGGLTSFFPDQIQEDYIPRLVITDFHLNGKPVLPGGADSPLKQSISYTRSVTLSHEQNIFAFEFSALGYSNQEGYRFRYRLRGLETEWHETDTSHRFFTYTTLSPGEYVFEVQGSNNPGVWNERGSDVRIRILPPWWSTWEFRVICAAIILGSLWMLYRLRLRQVAQQFNMRLKERVAERARIARDLHDTLLQSFQGLVFRFQAARYHLPDRLEDACEALDSALVSADQALAEGRSSIQELRSEPLKESKMEQALLAMGRELAASPKNGGSGSPPLRVIVEGTRRAKRPMIREEIYRIARELLRNAYRHANARSIEAELRYSDDAFVLIVRDDGKWIDPQVLKDRGRTGHWGLRGMYERAEGIGAQFDIWSEAGAGTEARLTVPGAIAYEKSGHGGTFKLFRKTRIYEHRS